MAVEHLPHQVGPVHPMMQLHGGERILPVGALDLAGCVPDAIIRPDGKGVVADTLGEIAAGTPAIT